jgi:hypothetical protein
MVEGQLSERVLKELIALRGYGGIRESWMVEKAPHICQLRGAQREARRQSVGESEIGQAAYDFVRCAAKAGLVPTRFEIILNATLNFDGLHGFLEERRENVMATLGMAAEHKKQFEALEARAYEEFSRRLVELESSPCQKKRTSDADVIKLVAEAIKRRDTDDAFDSLDTAYRKLVRARGDQAEEDAIRFIT